MKQIWIGWINTEDGEHYQYAYSYKPTKKEVISDFRNENGESYGVDKNSDYFEEVFPEIFSLSLKNK